MDYLNRGGNVTRKTRNIYNDQTFVSELPHLHKQQLGHCGIEVTSQTANAFKPSADRCSGQWARLEKGQERVMHLLEISSTQKGILGQEKREESQVHVGRSVSGGKTFVSKYKFFKSEE